MSKIARPDRTRQGNIKNAVRKENKSTSVRRTNQHIIHRCYVISLETLFPQHMSTLWRRSRRHLGPEGVSCSQRSHFGFLKLCFGVVNVSINSDNQVICSVTKNKCWEAKRRYISLRIGQKSTRLLKESSGHASELNCTVRRKRFGTIQNPRSRWPLIFRRDK